MEKRIIYEHADRAFKKGVRVFTKGGVPITSDGYAYIVGSINGIPMCLEEQRLFHDYLYQLTVSDSARNLPLGLCAHDFRTVKKKKHKKHKKHEKHCCPESTGYEPSADQIGDASADDPADRQYRAEEIRNSDPLPVVPFPDTEPETVSAEGPEPLSAQDILSVFLRENPEAEPILRLLYIAVSVYPDLLDRLRFPVQPKEAPASLLPAAAGIPLLPEAVLAAQENSGKYEAFIRGFVPSDTAVITVEQMCRLLGEFIGTTIRKNPSGLKNEFDAYGIRCDRNGGKEFRNQWVYHAQMRTDNVNPDAQK